MLNPNAQAVTADRMQQRHREAEIYRLAQATTAQTPTHLLTHRVMNALGKQMVATGQALLEKGSPQPAEWEQIRPIAS